MRHEAEIALALSKQAEEYFQSVAATYPDLASVIAQAHIARHGGDILRIWEKVDYSGEFEKFIAEATKFNPSDADYHLVGVSSHGGGWDVGAFEDPFDLSLHDYKKYEIFYESPSECVWSAPKKVKSEKVTSRLLMPAVFSTRISSESTVDELSLQEALDGICTEAMASVSGFLQKNPEIPEYATRTGIRGKGLLLRIFVRVEPASESADEGGAS